MEFILIQKFLWMILGSLVVYGGILGANSTRNKLATAKHGTRSDIKDLLGNDGLKISKKYRLSEKQCNGHTVVLAPTRVGKTTSIYIPNLLENNLRGTLIVPDPKTEIHELTSKYQQSIGRKIIVYKPLDKKIQYNPLKD
jgi:type IV secretion system protein VirD4